MKISKIIITISFIIFLILVARFAYSFGQNNATLTVKAVTPKQLAEAMQTDNFYGEYTKTMLLVQGNVKTISQHQGDTLIEFEVSPTPTALGKVACNLGKEQTGVRIGASVRVLTVAYSAERQHTADIFMPHCYLLQ